MLNTCCHPFSVWGADIALFLRTRIHVHRLSLCSAFLSGLCWHRLTWSSGKKTRIIFRQKQKRALEVRAFPVVWQLCGRNWQSYRPIWAAAKRSCKAMMITCKLGPLASRDGPPRKEEGFFNSIYDGRLRCVFCGTDSCVVCIIRHVTARLP